MDKRPGELPDPVIMRIIRRFLQLVDSLRAGLGPFPLLNASAKKSRRSPSPPQRATPFDASTSKALDLDAKAKNRLDSSPNSNNSRPSDLDLDANTDGVHPSAARPTGLAARRRRKRERRRAAADPDAKNAAADQECSVELEAATTPTDPDYKSAVADQERSVKLGAATKTTAGDPKHAAPSPELDYKSAVADQERSVKLGAATKTTACDPKLAAPSPDLDLVAKRRKDAIAAKKKRQRNNRRERRRAATDLGQERSAELATTPDPKPLAVAATSTTKNTVVSKKKRCTRPSSISLPELRPPAAATVVRQCLVALAGPLDDLEDVDSFFYGMFDQPDENEDRVRHLRYKEACSSLKSNLTFCLACFLEDEQDIAPIDKKIDQVTKHMKRRHKGGWIKCEKGGCYAMATTKQDIAHHHFYAH